MTEKLAAKKIGYLRRAPKDRKQMNVAGAVTAMWNKLVYTGHLDRSLGAYWRTYDGNAALEAYDAALSESSVAILTRLVDGEKVKADERGISTLIDAGLVNCNVFNGQITVNPDGEAIVQRLRDEAAPTP